MIFFSTDEIRGDQAAQLMRQKLEKWPTNRDFSTSPERGGD
jgi:hypothetical protein